MGITTREINARLDGLCDQLRHRQLNGPYGIAMATLVLIRQLVSQGRWSSAADLTQQVIYMAQRLRRAQPNELTTTNVCRRVLHLVREARLALSTDGSDLTSGSGTGSGASGGAGPIAPATVTTPPAPPPAGGTQPASALAVLFGPEPDMPGPSMTAVEARRAKKEEDAQEELLMYPLKPEVIQSLQEMIDEIDSGRGNIATQAAEYIHENEIILTMGRSLTIEAFLKAAHKKRRFQVVIAETSPTLEGHEQALALTRHGIQTTVISDAAILAVMPRMNKILLEAHTILANGGILAIAGSRLMSEAAAAHHIPVLVAACTYQLSPEVLFDPTTKAEMIAPSYMEPVLGDDVEEVNPVREYVPPASLGLYLTNVGAHPTSYLTRVLGENYDAGDTYLGW